MTAASPSYWVQPSEEEHHVTQSARHSRQQRRRRCRRRPGDRRWSVDLGSQLRQHNVHSQLAQQQVYFPPKAAFDHPKAGTEITPSMIPSVSKYAGQQLLTGEQAKTYADDFIAVHLSEMPYGGVYSKVSAASLAAPTNTSCRPWCRRCSAARPCAGCCSRPTRSRSSARSCCGARSHRSSERSACRCSSALASGTPVVPRRKSGARPESSPRFVLTVDPTTPGPRQHAPAGSPAGASPRCGPSSAAEAGRGAPRFVAVSITASSAGGRFRSREPTACSCLGSG